jgi:FkbM family methyltransferase
VNIAKNLRIFGQSGKMGLVALRKGKGQSVGRTNKLNKERLDNLISMLELELTAGYFVQIGAGAGDLDVRAKYNDGFTYIVKSLDSKLVEYIVLVEPNPINLKLLEECWSRFSDSKIFHTAIVTNSSVSPHCKFYFSELDGPNYQTCSIDPEHVLKHYPAEKFKDLRSFTVSGTTLETFLEEFSAQKIALLSLDIEGIDCEVVLETDFTKFDIQFLSLEYLHMGEKISSVHVHLEKCGFNYVGSGVDWSGHDILFKNGKVPASATVSQL